ncbi:unnamed protein product [Lymnaea stagnalis]|uniref:CUB domain-containing protein n=1 Tax=Lymnaea stagnalis TaxID=6523 RepID=A0AAV2IBH7_LYMST
MLSCTTQVTTTASVWKSMLCHKMNLNCFCSIILTFLCRLDLVVVSANETFCSTQSTLTPYGGSCYASTQCITNYCDNVCVCPVNTYYHSCTASCVLNCNAATNNPSGQIVSHDYPYNYPNYELCMWTLRGTSNVYYVISISYMDIEYSYNCSLDSLKIYDVKPNGNTQLAMFCNGKDTSKHIVATTSNSMLVVFKTDHSVQGRGFSGYYRSFAYNATITEPRRGYIASPGYPLKYPGNSYFSWTITGTPGSFISLIILNLSIENTYEHINIYDGDNINTRTLAHMDSNSVSQPVFMSTGSSLHIVFRSDSSFEYSGLLASYEINECQTILTGTSGDIVSPGYPLNYVENLSCSWTVNTDPNTIIFLRFDYI